MNAKTMEGLVGADANRTLVNTMRIYREASRKGDTARMERALGYAGEFMERAGEYKLKADEGMREEAQEAREKEQAELEKRIEECRTEGGKENNAAAGDKVQNADTLEISEEGRNLLEENSEMVQSVTTLPEKEIYSRPAPQNGGNSPGN